MNIGDYIKQQRQSRNWSMDQLSHISGVSKTHISNIENGHSDLTLNMLQFIAKAFDMAAGDMLVEAGYTIRRNDGHCPMCGYERKRPARGRQEAENAPSAVCATCGGGGIVNGLLCLDCGGTGEPQGLEE